MNDVRMGLGTDQLALPAGLEVAVLPTPREHGEAAAMVPLPAEQAREELAPWAEAMQLPGVDT